MDRMVRFMMSMIDLLSLVICRLGLMALRILPSGRRMLVVVMVTTCRISGILILLLRYTPRCPLGAILMILRVSLWFIGNVSFVFLSLEDVFWGEAKVSL